MRHGTKQGFSLVEISMAVTLLMIAMALGITGYVFSLRNVNEGDIQNELDMDVQLSMELLKKDLRLSSLDKIFYYPAGSGPYEAISFPLASDTDSDGLLEKDADGYLIWSKTVIYHIRPTTPNQLVVTTFNPRDNTLSDAQRQAQLEAVVSDGDGTSTYNGENASSHVIFENLLDWEILPKEGRFDAYSKSLARDQASLGYILLDTGSHDFTFKVIGKNSSSSGYNIGIDQLFVSPSYGAREAEAHLPVTSQSGATAANQYMPVGSWKGNRQLLFPASQPGSSFTLTIPNDQWEETNFGGLGYLAEDTRISFDQSLSPSDYIIELDGMDASWEASAQTADSFGHDAIPGKMMNMAVRMLVKGSDIAEAGGWIGLNGEECKLTFASSSTGSLVVANAYMGESAYTNLVDLDYSSSGPVEAITFDGGNSAVQIIEGTATSDWIEMPIDRDKNYVVAFTISNDPINDAPRIWNDYVVSSDPTNQAYWATEIATNAGHLIANDASWSVQGIPYNRTNAVIGLESIDVSYPHTGKYTSQIFDTHLDAPRYGYFSWNSELPSGTALAFKVRTGNQSDLSDASPFDSISQFDAASSSSSHSISASYNRYVQFQALMTSSSGGQDTPKLKDITIDWVGERQLVDIGGIFTKGPGYGIFEISVDGQPLRSALIVDLEIYKNITGAKGSTRQVTSSLKMDLTPRNSGM